VDKKRGYPIISGKGGGPKKKKKKKIGKGEGEINREPKELQ